jgi:hypothetical protein
MQLQLINKGGFTMFKKLFILVLVSVSLVACGKPRAASQDTKDAQAVSRQQSQYSKAQPVPAYDWSLERHLVIQLYNVRNTEATTHSVWRSDLGTIEGDCVSIGFGIPYDTSLTNPLVATNRSQNGDRHTQQGGALASIEQAEPNGIFASKNTAATWVLCAGESGNIDPVYVETKVTTYPYPVTIDYDKNRVQKAGKSTVSISKN